MIFVFFLILTLVLTIDQFLKFCILEYIPVGETMDLMWGGLLKLTLLKNKGAAFGVLSGVNWLFVGISAILILTVFYLVFFKKIKDGLFLTACALICGGGASNMFDRLFHGYVVDYLKLSFFAPVCNLADWCISIAIVLLVCWYFKKSGTYN